LSQRQALNTSPSRVAVVVGIGLAAAVVLVGFVLAQAWL
tara:strand:+ start:71 stop:187 length:117 start_codon:yes stop_codon:yes gene_type:complete